MFLDFGLSQEQFAYLNVVWAITIVLLEVPSGALADQFGRRKLVIFAAILMIIEMTVMLLMPPVDRELYGDNTAALAGAVGSLFAVFLVNRIISGAAEAAASGADEAIAYDSLPEQDRETLWAGLTKKLMIWQSMAFVVVTLIGAAVYDPDFVNMVLGWIGVERQFTQIETLKFPIALTLGMAIVALFIALRMVEPDNFQPPEGETVWHAVRESFARTFQAGGWILHTPAALMLLLVGLSFDSIIRLYYTVGSIWLEVIGFEPAQFGIISVVGSLTGIFAAVIGEKLINHRSPNFNFRLITVLTLVGIASLAFPIQFWSVMFLPTLWIAMRLLHFFLSNYLNRVTSPENRATVLSFRGLSMNLSYGILTWLYGLQTAWLLRGKDLPRTKEIEHEVFTDATKWWWVFFAAVLIVLFLFRAIKVRKNWNRLLD